MTTPNLSASMLWQNEENYRFAIKSFEKEGSAIGRKYTVVVNGQWKDIDRILEKAYTGGAGNANSGYLLSTFLNEAPNFSPQARQILLPPNVDAISRTPKLKHAGEGDKSELTLIFEEGLQPGNNLPGTNGTDTVVLIPGSTNPLPPDTTYRFVWEPNDVELAYGLPFRGGYKWDLTIQAPHLDLDLTPKLPDGGVTVEVQSGGSTSTAPVFKAEDLLLNLGYDPANISLMAVCNIWKDGALTEQQRGLLFQYLNSNDGGGKASEAYVLRILRGETQYRYWIPHITLTRRYRTAPTTSAFPLPGTFAAANTTNGPPRYTGAPARFFAAGSETTLEYLYLCTGPQVDFVGDQWQIECQWSGFLDYDDTMYGSPIGSADPID